jgi:DNA topoisomerase-3
MDCDREGENINFEVLDCCMHLMKAGGSDSNYDRVYRAFFSAINPSDIKKAYQALGKPDKNRALSVDARQELDLKIGVAFSRFQTRFFQGRYGDLDSVVLSYGPCQTPTLGFCVQRYIDIEMFKPEPFWVLRLGVTKCGRSLKALWNLGRSFNKDRVEQLLMQALKSERVVKVTSVVIKEKKQGRPIPLNTVALLKACSKALGIGPSAALQTAERLYLLGYLSYPRTESTAYPQSFDIQGTLEQQMSDNRWGSFVCDLLRVGHSMSRGGVDMGDHPPITPCRPARANELHGEMARVYDLVVRHFIASVSQDAVWRSTRVDFVVQTLGEKGSFTLRGKELVSPGFLAVLLHNEHGEDVEAGGADDEEVRSIPEFMEGECIILLNAKSVSNSTKSDVASEQFARATLEIEQKMTTPPAYLSEAELIDLMVKHCIGTDASIATHIENVQKRNYVYLESGRRLLPSKLGLVLVQGYHQIDSSLVLPQVRSDIEGQCHKIALGEASKDAVVRSALDLFRSKYDMFVKSIDKMDVLFASSFSKLHDIGIPFTRCGLTRRYLQYIPGPPPRLYNNWTESVYPLPAGGTLKQWIGRPCPVENCNFELCLYSIGHPQRTFPFCPRCFNDINFALDDSKISKDPVDRADEGKECEIRNMTGKSLVLECPLPDHHPLIEELTVSPDPDSNGVLMLDPHLGPKWRLVSTRAPTIVYLPQNIENVIVLDKKDVVFGIRLMQIDFKAGESPLPDGKKKHICCFANDELLQGMVRVYHGSDRLRPSGRGGRGRGRGRERGCRGRGKRHF